MKRFGNITFAIGAVAIMAVLTPARAATKCVLLDADSECRWNKSSYKGEAEWSVTCNSGINGQTQRTDVYGIGVCAKSSGNLGDVRNELVISGDAEENIYCWCRMLTPTVSKWVAYGTSSNCSYNCADSCAIDAFSSYESFRDTMFGSI